MSGSRCLGQPLHLRIPATAVHLTHSSKHPSGPRIALPLPASFHAPSDKIPGRALHGAAANRPALSSEKGIAQACPVLVYIDLHLADVLTPFFVSPWQLFQADVHLCPLAVPQLGLPLLEPCLRLWSPLFPTCFTNLGQVFHRMRPIQNLDPSLR